MKLTDKKIKERDNSTGQVIIEALIALTLLTTGIVSILVLINSSLRTLSYTPNRYLAANLAAEGIEIVRNIIDSNIRIGKPWNTGMPSAKSSYEMDY